MPDSEPEPPPLNGGGDGNGAKLQGRKGQCRHQSTQGDCTGAPLAASDYCKAHSCPHPGTHAPCNKDMRTNAKDCGGHQRPDNGLPTGRVPMQQSSHRREDGGREVRLCSCTPFWIESMPPLFARRPLLLIRMWRNRRVADLQVSPVSRRHRDSEWLTHGNIARDGFEVPCETQQMHTSFSSDDVMHYAKYNDEIRKTRYSTQV